MKIDQRKVRGLKRRAEKKAKFMMLDEGMMIMPLSTNIREHLKQVHVLSNQHLIDKDGQMKPSAILTQSLNDLQ